MPKEEWGSCYSTMKIESGAANFNLQNYYLLSCVLQNDYYSDKITTIKMAGIMGLKTINIYDNIISDHGIRC